MQEPAATRPHDLLLPPTPLAAHEHLVFVYDNERELAGTLRDFVDTGLGKRELVVFVHSFGSDETAWRFLHSVAPRTAENPERIVVVSTHADAFEGAARRIDYEHVSKVIGRLASTSAERDCSGVRIFVDASRRYIGSGRSREWLDFELWLGRRLKASVALVCAYQAGDLKKREILEGVLLAHAHRHGHS